MPPIIKKNSLWNRQRPLKKPNQIKLQGLKLSPNGHICKRTSVPNAQRTQRELVHKWCKSLRIVEFSVRLCLFSNVTATPINSHQYELNKVPKFVASTLHKNLQKSKYQNRLRVGEWEKYFYSGKNTTIGYPVPSSEITHPNNIILTE